MSKQSSTRSRLPTGQPVTGQIGIFWWWKGKLLAATNPVEDGELPGGKVDSKLAHVKTWPVLQKLHRGLRLLDS